MVLAGQLLAHSISPDTYAPIFEEIVGAGRDFLLLALHMTAQMAQQGYKRACFVGSGLLAGVTQESALKLLELTAGQLKTMSESTLELRHGPMAALDEETLFISFLSSYESRRNYEFDLLNEIGENRLVAHAGCGDRLQRRGVQTLLNTSFQLSGSGRFLTCIAR